MLAVHYFRHKFLLFLAFFFIGFAGTLSAAESAANFPSKPIKIIIPHMPGDTVDTIARTLSRDLGAAWGQPVVVESHPGAGGAIAAGMVARAPADGYTLLLTISSLVQNAVLRPSQKLDVFKDFTPVIRIASTPLAYIAHGESPYNSVAEFIEAAKKEPGKRSYASYGLGTTAHIYYELLSDASDSDFLHVPYKGGNPILADVMGRQVDTGLLSLSVSLPQYKAGAIKILAIANDERFPSIPEVPTFAEAGYPALSGAGWVGMLAPGGTPQPVVDKLAAQITQSLEDPQVKSMFQDFAIQAAPTTPAEMSAIIRSDYDKWSKVVKTYDIKVE